MTTQEFTELYNRTHKKVLSNLYYQLRDWDLARDMSQDLYAKCWQRFNEQEIILREEMGYLIKISNGMVIDYIRRKKAYNSVGTTKPLDDYYYDTIGVEPEINMEVREFVHQIHYVVERLPPFMRQIIKKRYFEEKSNKEASKELNINNTGIRNRLSQSIKRLKETIDKSNPVYYK